MSEKNKMKIEKKLIAAIVLVIAIGIAAVVPLTFFMNNASNASEPQRAFAASLFNLDIPCAYYNANATYNVEVNSTVYGPMAFHTYYRDSAIIAVQPSVNYAVIDNETLACIEIFQYTVYTDKLELQTSYSYFAFNESAFEQNETSGGHRVNIASKYWQENLLDDSLRGGRGYSFSGFSIESLSEPMEIALVGENYEHGYGQRETLEKDRRNILKEIENTQTIFLDVRRVAYILLRVDGGVRVLEDNKLVQHIELTKNADGFMFGDPAAVVYYGREVYFGLQEIPDDYPRIPKESLSALYPELFGK